MAVQLISISRSNLSDCWTALDHNYAGAKSPGAPNHSVDLPAPDAVGSLHPPAPPPDRHAGRLALVGVPGVVLTRVAA